MMSPVSPHPYQGHLAWSVTWIRLAMVLAMLLGITRPVYSQDFKSGSNGSHGALIAAPTLSGTGTITAPGGAGDERNGGSDGRIRLEAFNHQFTGSTNPAAPKRAPYGVFPPTALAPSASSLMVVSVNGIPLNNPSGSFTPPDVEIDTNAPVEVVIQARNIPLVTGDPPVPTVGKVHLLAENAADKIVDSAPLVGTLEQSTATASVTFPTGFTRAFVRATWKQ